MWQDGVVGRDGRDGRVGRFDRDGQDGEGHHSRRTTPWQWAASHTRWCFAMQL